MCAALDLQVFCVSRPVMYSYPCSDGAPAPQKKKNPNRLIVDDAVNDDNSVSANFDSPCWL